MSETQQSRDELDVNSMLIAEYEYLAQTAFQANEDRSRVSTFYLVSVASFIAAVLTTLNNSSININFIWAFVVLFFGLSLYGLLSLLQLARLRRAWIETARAMNHIKEYYFEHSSLAGLEHAFAWKANTLPPTFKMSSVAFLSALQIALLAAIMFGTAVAYCCLAINLDWLLFATASGIIFLGLQIVTFAWMLGYSA